METAQLKEEKRVTEEAVKNANAIEDVFTKLKPFKKCTRKASDLDVELEYHNSYDKMDAATAKWMFGLLRNNMKEYYDTCDGFKWTDKSKQAELEHKDARLIVARDMTSDAKTPVGFVHLRFEDEDLEPVLYVYEIQIEESVRRKGLGKFLMQLMEMIAWTNNMHKIMLTVIKSNKSAYNFYHDKLHYAADDTDPTLCEPLLEFGYEILCKISPKLLKAIKAAQAKQAQQAAQ